MTIETRKHIGQEIGVVEIHTFIQDGHFDEWFSSCAVPCIEDTHVFPWRSVVLDGTACIVQRPLIIDQIVIRGHLLEQLEHVWLGPVHHAFALKHIGKGHRIQCRVLVEHQFHQVGHEAFTGFLVTKLRRLLAEVAALTYIF